MKDKEDGHKGKLKLKGEINGKLAIIKPKRVGGE